MIEQVAGMLGPAPRIEISGRCGGGEALAARADRHRDHVLFEPLVIADAGVAACREDVDEAVLGGDFEDDVGIRRQEAGHDRRQHQPRGADRHVEPQRPRGTVAKRADPVERGIDLAERGSQPF